MTTTVADNPASSRFEITVDGELAGFLDYRKDGDEYALPHTRIFPQFEGRGLGTSWSPAHSPRSPSAAAPRSPTARSSPRSSATTPSFSSSCPRISATPSASSRPAATHGRPSGREVVMADEALQDSVRRLAEALKPGDFDATLEAITAAAVEVLPDVDYASITVKHADDSIDTVAPTDPLVLDLDASSTSSRRARATTQRPRPRTSSHRHRHGRPLPGLRSVRRVEGHPRPSGSATVRRACLAGRLNLYSHQLGAFEDFTTLADLFAHQAASPSPMPARSATSTTRSAPVRRSGRPSGSSWSATSSATSARSRS